MLIGHLAVSILEHRYLGTKLVPTLAGGFFPDIVDKTLCQVLHVTPNGRMWAHTLLALVGSTALVRIVTGEETAYAWGLGYAGHFLADSPETLPLAYPFKAHTFTQSASFREIFQRFFRQPGKVALEVSMVLLAALTLIVPVGARTGKRGRA